MNAELAVWAVRAFFGGLALAIVFFILRWATRLSDRENTLFKKETLNEIKTAGDKTLRMDLVSLLKRTNDRIRRRRSGSEPPQGGDGPT